MAMEALKRNGHNLHLDGFETVGPYGIPSLEPVTLDGTFPFIPFNCAKTSTVRAGLGVHFFIDDYLFERVWHDPDRYAQMLSDFRAVMSPDFSLFTDYPVAVQIYNLTVLLDVEKVAIGGGISKQPLLLESLRSAYDGLYASRAGQAYMEGLPRCQIVPCAFSSEANQVGVAAAYFEAMQKKC